MRRVIAVAAFILIICAISVSCKKLKTPTPIIDTTQTCTRTCTPGITLTGTPQPTATRTATAIPAITLRIFGAFDDGFSAYSIKEDPSGGYIVTGRGFSWATGECAMVMKIDTAGNILWKQLYSAYYYEITSDVVPLAGGGYVMSAWGEPVMQNTYNEGLFVAADSAGNSTTVIPYEYRYGYMRSINATTDGGYILAGQGAGGMAIKTDASGNCVWAMSYAGTSSLSYGIQALDGGYAFSGTDGVQIIKSDASGALSWEKHYYNQYYDYAACILQNSDGSYMLTGAYNSDRPLFMKVDASGDCVWAMSYSYNGMMYGHGNCVRAAPDGGYIIAGTTYPGLFGSNDGLIIKTDAAGNQQWLRIFGSNGPDRFASVWCTSDGGYIAAGDRDTGSWPCIMIVKLDAGGNQIW
jgi:hypothetical protein